MERKTIPGLGPVERKTLRGLGPSVEKALFGETKKRETLTIDRKIGFGTCKLTRITPEDAAALLEETEIHRSSSEDPTHSHTMTSIEGLFERKLGPVLRLLITEPDESGRVFEKLIHFSAPFWIDQSDDRLGLVAYVSEKDEQASDHHLIARPYYLSKSHGAWKLLPDAINLPYIKHFGKGYDEQSLTLPAGVQFAIDALANDPKRIRSDVPDAMRVFVGLAKTEIQSRSTYFGEVQDPMKARDMVSLGAVFEGGQKLKKTPPEKLLIDAQKKPDFSVSLGEWVGTTPFYGKMLTHTFPSADGNSFYLFKAARDDAKRLMAWVSGVETKSRIGSTGLKRRWVLAGDLTTPPFEYKEQVMGYGNPFNEKGDYQSVFEAYHNRIPVIQDYVKFLKEERGIT